MSRSTLLMMAALTAAAAAAGCNGASSASESEGAAPVTVAETKSAAGDSVRTTSVSARSLPAPAEFATRAPRLAPDASGIIETTFDDVKFPMEKTDSFVESMLTDRVKSLFGQRIRIRGYMYPTLHKRVKQFVLVRDNMECCFGPGAALFDCVVVTMAGDATAEYSIRPVAVEGEFRFETLPGPDGRPLAIYQMSAEAVK